MNCLFCFQGFDRLKHQNPNQDRFRDFRPLCERCQTFGFRFGQLNFIRHCSSFQRDDSRVFNEVWSKVSAFPDGAIGRGSAHVEPVS